MNKKLIIANWKMNIPDLGKWRNLSIPSGVEVVICPPFPFLERVRSQASGVKTGAQDVFWENPSARRRSGGAYTGEVSPAMLKNLGVEYVIIGHSERRQYLNETDEMINKKVLAALKAGLKVILCVGEPLGTRRKGLTASKKFAKNQLLEDLKGLNKKILHSKFYILNSRLIIAYEPVWAISTSGSGKICRPQDALEMIKYIKGILHSKFSILNSRVLYGGSVDSKNIADFIKYEDVDGALVGAASLKAEEFKKIIGVVANNANQK